MFENIGAWTPENDVDSLDEDLKYLMICET